MVQLETNGPNVSKTLVVQSEQNQFVQSEQPMVYNQWSESEPPMVQLEQLQLSNLKTNGPIWSGNHGPIEFVQRAKSMVSIPEQLMVHLAQPMVQFHAPMVQSEQPMVQPEQPMVHVSN
ncbi:hypothetical protein AVEN_17005-1 [Araneus ventricosus]|uniref:Uncharacterized protein n=1 Tax=Araneus ventricosus TaxID=182803 RepID=A0A4Y2SFM1_ARAVE|nr:hypothetical protein AVEN_17005-1 [Araneus ventricosus]